MAIAAGNILGYGRFIYKRAQGAGRRFLSALGGSHPRIVILLYHRVLPQAKATPFHSVVALETFKRQVEEIIRSYPVTSLSEAVGQFRANKINRRTQVVFTFDDGYEDNYEFAFPLLKKNGIKAAFFVAADYVGKGLPLWDWELAEALGGSAGLKKINLSGGEIRKGCLEAKSRFLRRVINEAKRLFPEERADFLRRFRAAGAIKDLPGGNSDVCMDWGQLAEMAHAGMEIGSHGLSHSSLGKWPDGRAREEIVKSKEVIEQRLNIPCRHFAFPFGARGDYNSRLITLARQAGYDACFLNIQGYNYFRGDPFYLKRIAVEEISNIRHILF